MPECDWLSDIRTVLIPTSVSLDAGSAGNATLLRPDGMQNVMPLPAFIHDNTSTARSGSQDAFEYNPMQTPPPQGKNHWSPSASSAPTLLEISAPTQSPTTGVGYHPDVPFTPTLLERWSMSPGTVTTPMGRGTASRGTPSGVLFNVDDESSKEDGRSRHSCEVREASDATMLTGSAEHERNVDEANAIVKILQEAFEKPNSMVQCQQYIPPPHGAKAENSNVCEDVVKAKVQSICKEVGEISFTVGMHCLSPLALASSLKLVFFDFDCTLTVSHVFASLAGISHKSTPLCVPEPHAKTERGQLAKLVELDTTWGPGTFALAAFGGQERVQEIRSVLELLWSQGVDCFVCSRGFLGPLRKCLHQVDLLQFFTQTYGRRDVPPSNASDEAMSTSELVGEEEKFMGTAEMELGSSKADIIRRCLQKRGLRCAQAILVDDDLEEIKSVFGTCMTIHVRNSKGMGKPEFQMLQRLLNVGKDCSRTPSGVSTPTRSQASDRS